MGNKRRPIVLLVATTVAIVGWLALDAGRAVAVPPTLIHDCSPAPRDCSGWFRSNVRLVWTVLPSTAQQTGCTDTTLSADSADSRGTYVFCSATDGVDRTTQELWIKLDKTPPTVRDPSAGRPPDGNGWYRAPVTLSFAGTDATSGIQACTTTTYAGPDGADAKAMGSCTDIAGNTSSPFGFGLRYDATGPAVTRGRPVRKPDHGRWYNRPVKWRFRGKDALSGLAGCPPVLYSGPGGRAARVIGACSDNAGNVATRSFGIRYDATPPAPPAVEAVPRDRGVRLRIGVASGVRSIAVLRAPGRGGTRDSTVYRGRPKGFTDSHARNGKRYRYTVVARDRAANRSRRTIGAVPGPRLLGPPNGALLDAPPRLRWTPVRNADYYNVQLRRDGEKVLSRWPTRPRLRLRGRWRFDGRVRRLAPGRYEWDVWPGLGDRSAAKYGARIGTGDFVIR